MRGSSSGCWPWPGELDVAALAFTFDPQPARLLHPEQAPAPLCWTRSQGRAARPVGRRRGAGLSDRRGLAATGGPRVFRPHRARPAARPRAGRGAKLLLRTRSPGDGRAVGAVLPGLRHEAGSGRAGGTRRPDRLQFAGAATGGGRRGGGGPAAARPALSHSRRGSSAGQAAATASAFPRPTSRASIRCCRGKGSMRARCSWTTARTPRPLSIGPNPTFHEQALKVEAHVLDFAGDLYDRPTGG